MIQLFPSFTCFERRSQWPRGLRRRSSAARPLRSGVRIPPKVWIFVVSVVSGRGLCDELITRSEASFWLWCIVVCNLETSRMRRPWPTLGRSVTKKNMFRATILSSWGWSHSYSEHVEDSNKCIIEETVRQVGYLQELYEDARSEKY
jgi:hypothetical protein